MILERLKLILLFLKAKVDAEMIKEKLAKLIDIKSIVTILLTFVFCYLAVIGAIAAQLFMTIFVVVIGFYFGTQAEKNKNKTE